MDFYFRNNPQMDILKIISTNLDSWMKTTPGLGTIDQVVAASGVGFGTVRRIRKGEINATIQNLEAIAGAFHRAVTDLLVLPGQEYGNTTRMPLSVQSPPAPVYQFHSRPDDPLIAEATVLLRKMTEHGKRVSLKHLKLIAEEHPTPKQTTISQ